MEKWHPLTLALPDSYVRPCDQSTERTRVGETSRLLRED